MKKIICVLLGIVLVVGAFCVYARIQYEQDYEAIDVQYTYLRIDNTIYKPAELVEIADNIFEGIVLDVSFIGSVSDMVSTVYTVAVTRTYKGETALTEKIIRGHGWKDYKLREQLQALQEAGAPEGFNRIALWEYDEKLQMGDTYLFFTKDRKIDENNDIGIDMLGINGLQDALQRDGTQGEAYYDEVKELLPYVPHPLLVWGTVAVVIGGSVFAFCVIRRKKKKKAEKLPQN